MSAENEIVKLTLECYRTLAVMLRNYELPKELSQWLEFSDRNLGVLQESKVLKHNFKPSVMLSKEAFANQLVKALWCLFCIGRLYNGLYLKDRRHRDFYKETVAYDKGVIKEAKDDTGGY